MNFGDAIGALKDGKHVQRAGWNVKGMFLYLVPGFAVEFNDLRGPARAAATHATQIEKGVHGSARHINGHIDMKAADGSLVCGWLASQTDMLADDWQVVVSNPNFAVSIADRFCEWKYEFELPGTESIAKIMDKLCVALGVPKPEGVLRK